ncbi:hypothetical protein EIB75_07835 [Epilithonimonas vandammei]|uniref:Uncharacterized protein n=1 Tax=Epilithonimonas vandammei TaxID=2487072 RepID=A0A3G8ZMN8_9FLAO|nr:hypothetical protein [Epilithonimonas vandammei]AZI55156.1 hypothetical protein EIB75_07835 [Epilithonimonas vandammei]
MFYKIIRKDDKIIYISKSDNMWGGLGDWYSSQDFYFNKDGILVGAIKKEDFFLEDTKCANQINYRAFYKNIDAPKLDEIEKILNENGKEISLDSPKCKGSKKQVLESINSVDKITFRSVEDFMKAEKIKYYTGSETLADNKEKECRLTHSNNLRFFGKEILQKFTFVEKYMDSIEINKKLNDDVYIVSEPSKKLIKIKREKLLKKQYKTIFDLYGIGQYTCISEMPILDNGAFIKLNRFYDETGQFFSFIEVDGVVNEKGEKIIVVSRFCLLKNDKYNYDSEIKKMGLVSRKYYKNETEINNDDFNLITKNSNIKSYTERFGKISENSFSDYEADMLKRNQKINKYATVGLQTLLNLIVK